MTKFYLVNASGGDFKDKETGEIIGWGNAHILKDEKENNSHFSGQQVSKVKTTKDFFTAVKGKLPAIIDCDIDITGKGEVRLVGVAAK